MQLTHVEINEKRLYTLLRELNAGKDVDMEEVEKLCKSLNMRLYHKKIGTKCKIYGLVEND